MINQKELNNPVEKVTWEADNEICVAQSSGGGWTEAKAREKGVQKCLVEKLDTKMREKIEKKFELTIEEEKIF